MAIISWPDVANGTLIAAASAIITSPWWLKLASPLSTICKTQLFRAKLEQHNASRLDAVEGKVAINGEQTAISIHQNKMILEALESATLQADVNGKVEWVSPRWTMMAGIQRDDAVGDGWFSAIRADDQERVIRRYEDAIAKGRPMNEDYHFVTGQRVRQTMEPIYYDGKVVAWMSEFERINQAGVVVGIKPVPVIPAVV
ncbi:MAG: PAS domain-containing protein [Tepidisphaeraceae bacterium]